MLGHVVPREDLGPGVDSLSLVPALLGLLALPVYAGIARVRKDSAGLIIEKKPGSTAPAPYESAADGASLNGPALPTNRKHAP